MNEKELTDLVKKALRQCDEGKCSLCVAYEEGSDHCKGMLILHELLLRGVARKEPSIPIIVIENYIQKLMDEWNSLGERRYNPRNMQVYNHIRAMSDDLNEYCKKMNWEE